MNRHILKIASLTMAGALSLAEAAVAQEVHRDAVHHEGGYATDGPRMEPGFFQRLYPAEVVMRHADAIALNADQKAAIKNALPNPGKGADRQRQRTEAGKLEQLLKSEKVDEIQALAQLDKLLEVEDSFKRRQLQALIKIKNILTPEQRLKLDELRKESTGRRKDEEMRLRSGERGSQTSDEPKIAPR